MTKCQLIVASLLLAVVILGGVIYFCNRRPVFRGEYKLFSVSQQFLGNIDVLTDKRQQYRGFSRQNQPCPDCGLLFIWPILAQPTMVMRDMSFALDFIWLRDRQIVQFTENAAPEGHNPQIEYQPDQPVDAVLEMPSGFIRRHNLQIGQSLSWR